MIMRNQNRTSVISLKHVLISLLVKSLFFTIFATAFVCVRVCVCVKGGGAILHLYINIE